MRGDAWHDSVRRLFAETVGAEFHHTICLVSPLGGAPVRLVTAVDPERQELLMLREVCVELARLPEVSRRDGELVPMGIVPAGSAQLPVPADDFVPVRGLGVGKLSPVVKDWLARLDRGMPASADGCSRCQEGQFADADAASCASCGAGTYADALEESACNSCARGVYAGNTGAQSCAIYAGGQSADKASSAACTSCAAGLFAEVPIPGVPGATVCTSCSSGQHAEGVASMCEFCMRGIYPSKSETIACDGCAAGTLSEGGSVTCSTCAVGLLSEASAAACTSCFAGQYQEDVGASSCTACVAGASSAMEAVSRATGCARCATGIYSALDDAASYDSCAAGEFQPAEGATECAKCEAGTFQNSVGAVGCASCSAGLYQPNGGKPVCESCPTGCNSRARSVACSSVAVGFLVAATAAPADVASASSPRH